MLSLRWRGYHPDKALSETTGDYSLPDLSEPSNSSCSFCSLNNPHTAGRQQSTAWFGWGGAVFRQLVSITYHSHTSLFVETFSLHRPTGPIKSLSCDVLYSSVCLSVPLRKPHFPVNCRLLVEERIAYIGIYLDFFVCHFNDFF